MILFPYAKINIGLEVLFKRNDGYHELETVFYPIGLSDILEINPSTAFNFTQTGIDFGGHANDNIVVKAYHLLQQKHALPNVSMHLHKQIPVGAGLGGGSSDAAFTLKGLNELFALKLSTEALEDYAAQLGSDCPFFIKDCPALALGRGENLTPINLNIEKYELVLVKPPVSVTTAEAYANIEPLIPEKPLAKTINLPVNEWKGHIENRFEKSVFAAHPKIQQIKNRFYDLGAVYAAMSGSGSAVFALFDKGNEPEANKFEDCFFWRKNMTDNFF
ncbi:MAG TPA: 4-(cytidine 5'-diphospho)-2-C-methyl-D-erythritol kinase [Prolixibacteraceae bacterium]|nr:4-(cytidine 5'-diphospho)-2-C-methyl-D-erythritol kinase [Prolixibacteraceae bacterium]